MIEGILDTIDAELVDKTTGINALIVTHNGTADFDLEPVHTFDVWDINELPSQLALPAIMVEWQQSPRLQLGSQGKWRGMHTVRIWYWINAMEVEKNRRHLAGMASVIRKWVDGLSEKGTIQEIEPIRMDALGWRPQADALFTALITTLPIVERDELAIP